MSIRQLKRTDIEAYAKGAIECLQGQLLGAKTPNKLTKLNSRINHWKRVLTLKGLEQFKAVEEVGHVIYDEVQA